MTTTASTTIASGQAKAQKVPLGATVNIPPRRLDFQFDDKTTARYFYDNDPFLSAFWSVSYTHLTLPTNREV